MKTPHTSEQPRISPMESFLDILDSPIGRAGVAAAYIGSMVLVGYHAYQTGTERSERRTHSIEQVAGAKANEINDAIMTDRTYNDGVVVLNGTASVENTRNSSAKSTRIALKNPLILSPVGPGNTGDTFVIGVQDQENGKIVPITITSEDVKYADPTSPTSIYGGVYASVDSTRGTENIFVRGSSEDSSRPGFQLPSKP